MPPRPRIFDPFTRRLGHSPPAKTAAWLASLVLCACASAPGTGGSAAKEPHPVAAGALGAAQAGERCRTPGDTSELKPPAPGHKRFEMKLSASGGSIVVASEALGRFVVEGPQTRCVYVDLLSPSEARFSVTATANEKAKGVLPEFLLSEYGPVGPFWYETLNVECQGKYGQCDSEGADQWQASLAGRKRGRLDPCGSAVVKSLRWDTSGSESARDGEFFHDFTVSFDLEVKAFATRFAPGSTECVPK